MTRLLVRGTDPTAARATERDQKLLTDLASYREMADGVAAQVHETDRKMRVLDQTLDLPNAYQHPNYLEASNVASRLFWRMKTYYSQLSALADQVQGVVRQLSPAAMGSCRELWSYDVCEGLNPAWHVWSVLKIYPPQLRGGWGKGKDMR